MRKEGEPKIQSRALCLSLFLSIALAPMEELPAFYLGSTATSKKAAQVVSKKVAVAAKSTYDDVFGRLPWYCLSSD